MIYLNSFTFPSSQSRVFPHRFMREKGIQRVEFSPITIFCGSNGSGKSTMLNIIARAIGVTNMTLGNEDEYFRSYVKDCSYIEGDRPEDTTFIRSEDIMEGIASIRKRNEAIFDNATVNAPKMDAMEIEGLSSIIMDPLSASNEDRFWLSRIKLAQDIHGKLNWRKEYYSNGETAMRYFSSRIMPNSLVFLDEPENSLDAQYQHRLAAVLESLATKSKCQFIFSTHSPFLLAIEGAKILDLDSYPVRECRWYQLSNMRYYYRFFNLYSALFDYEEDSH